MKTDTKSTASWINPTVCQDRAHYSDLKCDKTGRESSALCKVLTQRERTPVRHISKCAIPVRWKRRCRYFSAALELSEKVRKSDTTTTVKNVHTGVHPLIVYKILSQRPPPFKNLNHCSPPNLTLPPQPISCQIDIFPSCPSFQVNLISLFVASTASASFLEELGLSW